MLATIELTPEQIAVHRVETEYSGRKCFMADSKKKRGKADRSRVAGSQRSEVYYVARKYGVSADTVRSVIKRVGNSRKKVYAALDKM
jgi:hypothetical protein